MPLNADLASLIRRGGDDLLSIDCIGPENSQALADRLRGTGDWLECVAGIESVVVQYDTTTLDVETARQRIEEALRSPSAISDLVQEQLVEVPVCYGGEFGPDFDNLCLQLGLTHDELVELHTGREYRVDMLGFTPGFAYVGGLDDRLNVPRLREPRVRVAAGSIGIADGRTGIYALPGPGGWQLIGRTALALFKPQSEEPFVLRAGMRVRFTAVDQPQVIARTVS